MRLHAPCICDDRGCTNPLDKATCRNTSWQQAVHVLHGRQGQFLLDQVTWQQVLLHVSALSSLLMRAHVY